MGRPKGLPKTGGGSRKGIPNKITSDLRSMVHEAVERAGGVESLLAQAQANPVAFLTLFGKCLPKELDVRTSEPLLIRWER